MHAGLTAIGAAFVFLTGAANAATTFQVDYDGSSVSVNNTGGFGTASIQAELALTPGYTFDLETGETETIPFILWSSPGLFGVSQAEVEATLAFEEPAELGDTTAGGSASAFSFLGYIVAGSLYWDGSVPKTVTLSNGSIYTIGFQEGSALLVGTNVVTNAWVYANKVVSTPSVSEAPVPAALPLFFSALGGLGLLGWRAKRKPKWSPNSGR